MLGSGLATAGGARNEFGVAVFNVSRIRDVFLVVVLVCAAVQWLLFSGEDFNFLAVLFIVAVSVLAARIVLSPGAFWVAPIPALMIFFFNVSGLSGPLLFKTLEGSSVVSNLTIPSITFGVLAVAQLAIVYAFYLYVHFGLFRSLRNVIAEGVWRPLGLFVWPADAVFWVMGGLGLVATFLSGTNEQIAEGDAFTKFLVGLQFFRYAPFLIAFGGLRGKAVQVSRNNLMALVGFFGLLLLAGLVRNTRGTFVDAGMMCLCVFILCLGNGTISLKKIRPGHLLALAVVGGGVYLFLTRLALAMVAVRGYRASVDNMELISLSLEAFFDSRITAAYQSTEVSAIYIGGYGENYISSRLLSRLVMVKYHDNMLYYLSLINADSMKSLVQFSVDSVIGILPQSVIDFIGLGVDKTALRQSFGDYAIYLVDGWGLGGYKTGSMIANLYAVTGWAFPLVLLFVALFMFVLYDSFRSSRDGFCPLFGLMVWSCVGTLSSSGFNAESVSNVITGAVRMVPQMVILYLAVFHLFGFLGRRRG